MTHDRIHARKPDHHIERWSVGTIERLEQQDGHCVVTVSTEDDDLVELVVTLAIRDLFVRRLELQQDAAPEGERVWFRKHGG